jgi:hypothetical protein
MLEVRSLKLLDELARRRRTLQGRPISGRITVPEELKWWYWHEYGTRPHKIEPRNADYLKWPDPEGKYGDAVFGLNDGYARFFSVNHPGFRAKHMVASVLHEHLDRWSTSCVATFVGNGYNRKALEDFVKGRVLTDALSRIVARIREALPGTNAETGKLRGASAADVFAQNARIT